MLVHLRDGCAQTTLRAATPSQKLQIKLAISPSHSILTPGQPVLAPTLQSQAPGRVATGIPTSKSQVLPDLQTSKVPDQNGVSQAWYIAEVQHSGREPSK